MSTFEYQRVWHSSLKYKSPLIVKFSTGRVLDSKYDDDAQIIFFNIRGDTKDYYYQIENDAIARQLEEEAEGGVYYSLTAMGKADEAELTLTPVDESDLPDVPAAARSNGNGGNRQKTSNQYAKSLSTGTIAGDMELCAKEAVSIMESVVGDGFSLDNAAQLEAIEKLTVSLFINWSKTDFTVPLTKSQKDSMKEDDQPSSSVDMSGVQRLLDELPLKSGTSHDDKKLGSTLNKINKAIENGAEEAEVKAMENWLTEELAYQTEDPGEEELPF